MLLCPSCQYPMFCPCEDCVGETPEGYMNYISDRGEMIECPKCSLTREISWWADESTRQMKSQMGNVQ